MPSILRRYRLIQCLLGCALACGLLPLMRPQPLFAQSLEVQSSISWVYGQTVTFHVQASAPVELVSARLTIQVGKRANPYSTAVPLTSGSGIDISQTLTIQDLMMPPAAQITYYWDFQDQAGNQYRSSIFTERYYDNRVPWD